MYNARFMSNLKMDFAMAIHGDHLFFTYNYVIMPKINVGHFAECQIMTFYHVAHSNTPQTVCKKK